MKSPTLIDNVESGSEHLQGFCPKCRMWRMMSPAPLEKTRITIDFATLTLAQIIARLRCRKCGCPMEAQRAAQNEGRQARPGSSH